MSRLVRGSPARRTPRAGGPRPGGRPAPAGDAADSGQSLVEFALVLPILLVLVFGIVEFGAAFRTYQSVTNIAREGARRAVLPDPAVSSEAAVRDHVNRLLDGSGLDSTRDNTLFSCTEAVSGNTTQGSLCTDTGDTDEVQLDYPYTFFVLGGVLDLMCDGCGGSLGTITLSSVTRMRNE